MNHKAFISLCATFGIEPCEAEFKFHPERKWRFDFCFLRHKVAVEVEGGVWSNGRHTRGSGFIKDMEKYNAATELGWRILRFTPSQLGQSKTYETIKQTLYS